MAKKGVVKYFYSSTSEGDVVGFFNDVTASVTLLINIFPLRTVTARRTLPTLHAHRRYSGVLQSCVSTRCQLVHAWTRVARARARA